ncbi:DUF488 family protein [Pseudogulbenkiania sp. MAI-1]|uniref:DUF488 domain-containing protein n=1 Tax=Pseudogulbenkiania sp. MAI-1 TaxID=990370 RepID=UPI00045E8C57|nr:DUF488 domain-containing protein [Pseudogulbenkiania sp. MAI-1]
MKKIFTIGYEGANVGDFIETLKEAEVDVLLDIREMPLSRKAGFSKTALSMLVTCAGLEYRHIRALGAPKDVRNNLKATGDWVQYFKDFDAYLVSQQDIMIQLSSEINGNIALMCYERDPKQCHRSSVARELGVLTGSRPVHLGVRRYAQSDKTQNLHLGQGASPA